MREPPCSPPSMHTKAPLHELPVRNAGQSGFVSQNQRCPRRFISGTIVSRIPHLEGKDMLRLDADRPVEFCDGLRRRDFLHAGSLSALGLSLNSLFGLKAQGAV